MSNKIDQTLEEISYPRTSGDLWDELNKEINTTSIILNLPPGTNITVRFLGPFVMAQRFYAPFRKFSNAIDIEGITNLNPKAIEDAKKIIMDQINSRKGLYVDNSSYKDSVKMLNEIYNKERNIWQKCIMVNVLIKNGFSQGDSRLKVLPLIRSLSNAILVKTGNNQKMKLSGINAHDISITKVGQALQTKFSVDLCKQISLSASDIEYVLSNGLYDIPQLVENINSKKSSAYYYKIMSNYKMPEEFMKNLIEGSSKNVDKHFESVEESLNEIPSEAFEKINHMKNSINSLEV